MAMPEDLKPGVYPIAINVIPIDSAYFIPTVYGRFIVGGNMGKVLNLSLQTAQGKTEAITLVVQGNPPDMMNFERDKEVLFDAKIYLYDKNDVLFMEKKITGQSVEIYRNLDITLDTPIRESDIYKAKVELSDEKGIFDTYEKLFSPSIASTPWVFILFVV